MSILGQLLYRLYFRPKNNRALIKKFGGKLSYLAMLEAEREMKSYALNDLTINGNFGYSGKFKINFLTGEKYIHQTLFCTYSFFKFLTKEESSSFSINFYSDGTLNGSTKQILATRFPNINVIGIDDTTTALNNCLPNDSFPFINKQLNALPLFKKLIYPHLKNKKGRSTFFDSDMLFMKRPASFLNWLYKSQDDSDHAFCIQDIKRSYGYSDSEILEIWPIPIERNINSGMYSIDSANIDFMFIEKLIKNFEEHLGSQYYMEQLITAIILEKSSNLFVASPSEYIVLPTYDQIKNQMGTLHHYVNESKEFYLKESWKRQIQ
jgi:hypothetical protein